MHVPAIRIPPLKIAETCYPSAYRCIEKLCIFHDPVFIVIFTAETREKEFR
jgi:hypothetical protein